jgi:hypothetical protein
MKNKLVSILVLSTLLISVHFSFSQTPASNRTKNPVAATQDTSTIQSKDFYLELRAIVRQLKSDETAKTSEIKLLDSTLITIYSGEVPYSEFWTNKKGKCLFKLPLDKNFKIEISKTGFVTKYIMISTKVPNDKRDIFSFSFDVDLFEEIKGLDVSVLKQPIAKVAYNLTLEGFAYDVAYTSRINTDLKKMYKNYYRLQKIESDSILIKNDSATINQKK